MQAFTTSSLSAQPRFFARSVMRICNVNGIWVATRATLHTEKSSTQVPAREITLHWNVRMSLSPGSGQWCLILRVAQDGGISSPAEWRTAIYYRLRARKVDDKEITSSRGHERNISAYSSAQLARIGDPPAFKPFRTTIDRSASWKLEKPAQRATSTTETQDFDSLGLTYYVGWTGKSVINNRFRSGAVPKPADFERRACYLPANKCAQVSHVRTRVDKGPTSTGVHRGDSAMDAIPCRCGACMAIERSLFGCLSPMLFDTKTIWNYATSYLVPPLRRKLIPVHATLCGCSNHVLTLVLWKLKHACLRKGEKQGSHVCGTAFRELIVWSFLEASTREVNHGVSQLAVGLLVRKLICLGLASRWTYASMYTQARQAQLPY